MKAQTKLRGMATLSYWADDVKVAGEWYNEVFGIEPYFYRPDAENPVYIEYRVGDYQHEVGIINFKFRPQPASDIPGGTILYWHVDDIEKSLERLFALGAKPYQSITKWGEGFITAAVIDPFGNILGIMYNQHYLDVLGSD